MLIAGLALLAMASDPRPPRPSDETMLALVTERMPGAVVVEAHDRPMPSDLPGAKAFCGIARIEGRRLPFFVYTLWRPVGAELGNRWSTVVRGAPVPGSTLSEHFEDVSVTSACPELVAREAAR